MQNRQVFSNTRGLMRPNLAINADCSWPGYAQLLRAVTGSFSSEFEPLLSRINFCSDEVDQAIRLAEANLNNFERQLQSSERDAAERHRLSTILHRKEQAKVEADRITQMQLERRRKLFSPSFVVSVKLTESL